MLVRETFFFFLIQAGEGSWPVGLNQDEDQGEVSMVSHSKSLPGPGLGEPPPHPSHAADPHLLAHGGEGGPP